MSKSDMEPSRNWREIAARVAREKDSTKIFDLVQQLIRTLDAETSARIEHITVDDKTRERGAA